jgi:AcrR family transcriptional regulator
LIELKRTDTQRKKEKILNCAETLFAREGFKGVSIREISTEAECNQAMIHYYFGNKENLYQEVFKSRWLYRELKVVQCFKEALAEISQPTPAQLIEAYARAYIDGPLTDPEKQIQRLLVVRELASPGEAFEFVLKQITRPITNIFLKHLKPFIREGTDEKSLIFNILAVYGIVYYFTYSITMVSKISRCEYNQELKQEMIRNVVAFSLKGLPLKK